MNDDIPELLPPEEQPPVRTQQDLFEYWQSLMGPLGFSQPVRAEYPSTSCDG